jgi:hypothetical protein
MALLPLPTPLLCGSMVGSNINSAASAHLMRLGTHCDLDGPLLVLTPCDLVGGFGWGTAPDGAPSGDLVLTTHPGIGLEPRPDGSV